MTKIRRIIEDVSYGRFIRTFRTIRRIKMDKQKIEITKPNRIDGTGYTCDWCGISYPLGVWDYYQLVLFGRELKTICSDCYKHLKHITIEKQLKIMKRRTRK